MMPNDLEQRAYERQQKLGAEFSSLLASGCPAQQLIDKHEEWQQAIDQPVVRFNWSRNRHDV